MLPSLFVSHGAPTLPLDDCPARQFLSGLGQTLPRPNAILAVSAHWDTDTPAVNRVQVNETIYDFRGFPEALYKSFILRRGHRNSLGASRKHWRKRAFA